MICRGAQCKNHKLELDETERDHLLKSRNPKKKRKNSLMTLINRLRFIKNNPGLSGRLARERQ